MAKNMFRSFSTSWIEDCRRVIHVACRDQIARLHDLNGDLEIDWIECFNNDHQVTEHFHEFAMGLQTDDWAIFTMQNLPGTQKPLLFLTTVPFCVFLLMAKKRILWPLGSERQTVSV